MTWQPIETAPVNEIVELGRWRYWTTQDKKDWVKDVGRVYESRFFGIFKRRIDFYHSHWRPLPTPPE